MDNAPSNCPSSTGSGESSVCAGCPNRETCSSSLAKNSAQQEENEILPRIRENLGNIKHIILVISGKGGTGKSTLSSNIARCLASDLNLQVGLLDLDICGPSIPRMFDLEGHMVHESANGWDPVLASENLAIMSCGFLVDSLDDAIIWRGPKKNTLIREFLTQVNWGDLDYLIIDTPPGTSDEHISVVNYLKKSGLDNLDGAIMVSTPQEVSLMDVRKQVDFCKRTGLKILGVIENMAEFTCPKCCKKSQIFKPSSGGVAKMVQDYDLKMLASFPLNPLVGRYCDFGQSIFDDQANVGLDSGDFSGGASSQDKQPMKDIIEEFFKIRYKILSIDGN